MQYSTNLVIRKEENMAIYKLNGKYQVRVNVRLATNVYKRLSKTVSTYSEAKKIEKQLITKNERRNTLLFSDLLDDYLADRKARVKPVTYYTLEKNINRSIRPYLGSFRICDIHPGMLLNWQLQIQKRGIAESTLRNIENLCKTIFQFAEAFYNLEDNPFAKIKYIGKCHQNEMNFWTVDEFKKVLKTLQGDDLPTERFRLILLISFFCGTRLGETFALTREDINYKEGIIHINKTYSYFGGKETILPPKSKSSIRNIAIPPFLAKKIKQYVSRLPKQQKRLFEGTPKKHQVDRLKKVARAANVKEIRFHDLRHSAVSYWLHLGVPIYDISKRCGHATPTITYNVYSHLYPGDDHITPVLEKAGNHNT